MMNIYRRSDALGLEFSSKFSSACEHETRIFRHMFLCCEIAIWSYFCYYSIDSENPNPNPKKKKNKTKHKDDNDVPG